LETRRSGTLSLCPLALSCRLLSIERHLERKSNCARAGPRPRKVRAPGARERGRESQRTVLLLVDAETLPPHAVRDERYSKLQMEIDETKVRTLCKRGGQWTS